MIKGIIRLQYRKIIDVNATKTWDKLVFDASYNEFLLQSQFYNQEKKYTTFRELLTHVPAAEKLHFLVTPAIIGHLQQLNGKVPDILNQTGKLFLPFKGYKFEIINSDVRNKAKHLVVVNFISEPLTWYDTVDNLLLVSANQVVDGQEEILTEMFTMQPYLSIYSLKKTD
jgi:hypothetical protein